MRSRISDGALAKLDLKESERPRIDLEFEEATEGEEGASSRRRGSMRCAKKIEVSQRPLAPLHLGFLQTSPRELALALG